MQLLWSRAAQAHFCACRACAHISHGAVGRTTAAVGRRRRRPTFSDIFTAFYTTILGTAAVLDARYKDGRRHEPGRGLEGARGRPAQLREAHSLVRRVDMEPSTSLMRVAPLGAIEALNSICKTEIALERHQISNPRLNSLLRTIHHLYDPENKLGNSFLNYLGPELKANDAAVQEEALADTFVQRHPVSNTQFQQFHAMINRLVDKLISQSYYDEIPWDPERARRNLESLDSAWTAIRMLRSEGYPRYNHVSVDHAAAKEQQDKLTATIRVLFEDWNKDKSMKPKFQVAKICYNLLVCPFPPNIYHYNMLLMGFTRKSMYNLGDIVVESLLEDSRLRPTPQTVVCLLLHYRRKRDITGFYNIIRRMMAIDNRGMLLRRKRYETVLQFRTLSEWAMLPEVTTSLKANWVIERPERNQDIYEVLISGLLSFGRVKDAVKVFVGSLQERLGTSLDLFISLLKHCLYKLDAPAAEILLRGLVDNAEVMVSLMIRDNCPAKMAEHLYPILNMGKPPSWPFTQERAQMVWYSRTMAPTPEDWGRIRLLTTAMFIRQTCTHLKRLGPIVRRMTLILDMNYPEVRTVVALEGLNELNHLMQHHQFLAGRLLKHQALLRVAKTLERLTWDFGPGKVKSIYLRVASLLENALPRPAKEGGYEKTERLMEVSRIADGWIQYRLSRMHGIRSKERVLMLEAEWALFMGRRLVDDARHLVPDDLMAWASLGLDTPDAIDELQRADGDECSSNKQDMWPNMGIAALLQRD